MPEPIRVFGARGAEALDDPDITTGAHSSASTVLEDLRAELAEEAEADEALVDLLVPQRPRYMVRFAIEIPHSKIQTWRKRSKDKSLSGGTDELRFAAIALANQCRGLLRDGELVTDSAGTPVTLASQAFLETMGVGRAVDAVTRFYRRDADVIKAGGRLLIEAGYDPDDEGEGLDPTTPPSSGSRPTPA